MVVQSKSLRGLAAAATLGVSLSACHYVKQDDLDGRLATLRQDVSTEMSTQADTEAQRDAQLSQRVDGVESKMAQLQTDLNDLQQQYDVTVRQLESSIRFDMPVYFEFDQADVQAQGRDILTRFSQIAQKYYPDALLTVEGFTDTSGSEAYNIKLGQRRADAVKDVLVQNGLAVDGIRAVSYGENSKRLVEDGAKGPGTAGWQNRRVVVVIDHATSTTNAAVSSR